MDADRGGRQVRDLMSFHVFTLSPDDDVEALHQLMARRHVRHVPIVDAGGSLVGLATHRDLTRTGLGNREEVPLSVEREILRRRRIGELMSTEIETVGAGDDLRKAGERLIENKIGCLPVVEDGRLVGILTESDFVRDYVENG